MSIDRMISDLANKIRNTYNEQPTTKHINVLVYGKPGTGKTQLLTTARKPVLIHNFDPSGPTTRALRPYIEKGDIIIQDFSNDDSSKPTMYRDWQTQMAILQRDNFFSHLGTFAIDSLTSFGRVMANHLIKNGQGQTNGTLTLQGYGVQLVQMYNHILGLMHLPCDIIVTGHIELHRDEVSGEMHTSLAMPGKQAIQIPTAFMEKWVSKVQGTPKGTRFVLQTKTEGKYDAETRIGGDKFETYEEPNIKALLRKAGLSDEDKPSLFHHPNPSTEGESPTQPIATLT